jgi:hypothetical protein
MEPTIRHVRYEDFYSLESEGFEDLENFRRIVDALVRRVGGSLSDHHVVLDLRHATIPPIPEAILTQALDELSRRGIGVANKVAIVYDPGDAARATRMVQGEEIAAQMGVRLRAFDDTADALDWLSGLDEDHCEQAGGDGPIRYPRIHDT